MILSSCVDSMKGYSSRKPRVCLISHAYLEKCYRAKLPCLAESVDLRLISPDQFQYPYGLYRADFSTEWGYHVQVYPCRFPAGVRTSTRWVLASRDLGFQRFQPDIIHVENEVHSFSVLQALLYRRLFAPKAKVIVFVWANQRLNGMKGWSLNLLAHSMRPGIDSYIAGNSEAKTLLMECGVSSDHIAVFPLVGLDVKYYTPVSPDDRIRLRADIGIAPNEFVIGYVGRFVEDKGILDLLKAVRLFQKYAECTRLLCVGDGPLKNDLLTLQPDVMVAFPGGSSEVLPYYQLMDVLVLPSRTMPHWKEQFGLVLVEAMACGVPVVGSNSGAIPEVIGDAGLVFPEGNVQELARHLQSLKTSPDLRCRLSELGKHRATEEYSVEHIARKTLATYQQLLARSGSSIA
jgi:glycosyltransferase involved in cell wall biosynthesis